MTVDEIFARVRQLPPGMPKVAQELLESFDKKDEEDSSHMRDVADKVAMDQVLMAKVLRLANSAYFGGARNVGTLDQAVVLLGLSALRTLVIASSATTLFPTLPNFDKNKFWRNSFLVASLARELARMVKIDPNVAFVCGMLHRIGDLLIRMAEPELSADIDGYEEVGVCRAESQQKVLGLDYAIVGAELASRWEFPEVIQQAIKHQLEPRKYEDEEENFSAVLAAAAHLVKVTDEEMDEDDEEFYPEEAAKLLGLNKNRVLDRLEMILEKGEDLASMVS